MAERRLAQLERGTELITGIFADLNVQRVKESGKPLESELGERLAAAAEKLEGDAVGDPITVARLQLGMGESLIGLGHAAPAALVLEKSVKTRRQKLGNDHPDTLASMSSLATCYAAMGRLQDAATLREQVLALRKVKLEPDHPDVLLSMSRLAVSYALLDRHPDAVKLGVELLALQKAKLGPDHPNTLATMNNLAHSYSALGRHSEALKLIEETQGLMKAKLGPDHPDTLTSTTNLANCYFELGRNPEALKLRQELVELQKVKRGPDHPSTLEALHNLALSHFAAGRHSEALKLFEELLALRKTRLGLAHPYTLESICSYTSLLEKLGRGSDGLPLIYEALAAAAGRDNDPGLESLILILRVQACGLRGDPAGCRHAVERLIGLGNTDSQAIYDQAAATARLAATVHAANSSSVDREQKEVDAARAVNLLRQAVAAGYRNTPWIEQDPAWDTLRGREDYRLVMIDLNRPTDTAPIAPPRP